MVVATVNDSHERYSAFSDRELVQDFLFGSATLLNCDTDPSINNSNNNNSDDAVQSDTQPLEWSCTDPHYTPVRREAQSVLYRQWQRDRTHKIAQLAAARDPHALHQAQRSMQRFQHTLAAMQSGSGGGGQH